jgi:hypothetical protein
MARDEGRQGTLQPGKAATDTTSSGRNIRLNVAPTVQTPQKPRQALAAGVGIAELPRTAARRAGPNRCGFAHV